MPEDNLEKEIEIARKEFKEGLEKREKEAEDSIEKILSKNQIEFCSRCNVKISDRLEWAGRCMHKACTNLICANCWSAESKRYCADHYEEVIGKEKEGKKKVFFKPEDAAQVTAEPKEVLSIEDPREKILNLTKNFSLFLRERLNTIVPDWALDGWIENPKQRFSSKSESAEIAVFSKHLLSKKDRLKIFVTPVYGKTVDDLDFALSTIKEEHNIYHILILIGDGCDARALEFVDSFSRANASLFLIEPAKHLMYMDEKPLTKAYSSWFDSTKVPQKLREILKGLVKEKASGRDLIASKSVSEKFGFTEQDALIFLSSCKFLRHVENTDTFYFTSQQ